MINNLKIKNFKCFKELDIDLSKMTILSGVNSGGKSSIIQSIVLLDTIYNLKDLENEIDLSNIKHLESLYTFNEILNDDSVEPNIEICINNCNKVILLEDESSVNNSVLFKKNNNEFRNYGKLWFLPADRSISIHQTNCSLANFELGDENEHIAFILDRGKNPDKRIPFHPQRTKAMNTRMLYAQVNEWLSFILPGNKVDTKQLGDNLVSLTINNKHKSNVGFGIGFILPIIVTCLLAKDEDVIIVENPELHLHPKAQSNLGVFLTYMAHYGAQIIVETHSDHILNGIRKACLNSELGDVRNEIDILFMGQNAKVTNITIDENANFSDWPKEFLDQFEEDLFEIRKKRFKNE